jgi:pimeloyl-ACP methyl ester carboxylesterase
LRRDLDEVRRRFDPDRSDAAFDRTVLVGHSMGGLLARMMVEESGTRLWYLVSDRPAKDLEALVSSGHLCRGHVGVIREVRRILGEDEAR